MITINDVIKACKGVTKIELHHHEPEEEIGAESIAFNDVGLTVCEVVIIFCDHPRLNFARALGLFPDENTFLDGRSDDHPFGFLKCTGNLTPLQRAQIKSEWANIKNQDSIRIVSGDWEYINITNPTSKIHNGTIGRPYKMGMFCCIGGPGFGYERDETGVPLRMPHLGNVVIGDNVEIGSNVCIDRAVLGSTVIGENVKVDNLVHIAHNAKIGKNTLIVAGAVIGGSVEIGENCFIGMNASIKQKVKIGNRVTIGAGAVVLKDVPDGETWIGNPARKLVK